jgi:hypothetical protein
MITAQDIESARRIWIDAMGTDREHAAKAELVRLIELAKAQKPWRQCV